MQVFEGGSIPRLAASDPSALPRWSSLRRTADRGFEARLAPERRTEAPSHRGRATGKTEPDPPRRPREEPPAGEVDPRGPRIEQRPEPATPQPEDAGPAAVVATAAPAEPAPTRSTAPGSGPVEGQAGLAASPAAVPGLPTPAPGQTPTLGTPTQGPPGPAPLGTAPLSTVTGRSANATPPTPTTDAPPTATTRRIETPRPPLPRGTSPALLAQAEATRDRIVQQVVLQTAPDGGRVRLSLTPPELGRLDVELVVEDGRHARLVLVADRPETAQVLERALPDLARSLADQGLVLDESRVGTRDPSADRSAPDGRDGWGAASEDFADPVAGLWRPAASTLRGGGLDWIA